MSIKDFQTKHKEFCNRYNKNLDLFYRCSEFIEAPERTAAELEKYCKILNVYAKALSELLQEYKKLEGKELSNRITLGGFIKFDEVA